MTSWCTWMNPRLARRASQSSVSCDGSSPGPAHRRERPPHMGAGMASLRPAAAVRAVEGLFAAAISGWSLPRTKQARAVPGELRHEARQGSAHFLADRLFVGECGAALHALVSTIVEGKASWSAFRDTAVWREANSVTYSGMLTKGDRHRACAEVAEIIHVLDRLAQLRNGAYGFFRRVGAFDGDYFGGRAALVEAACEAMGHGFADGKDASLSAIYRSEAWSEGRRVLPRDHGRPAGRNSQIIRLSRRTRSEPFRQADLTHLPDKLARPVAGPLRGEQGTN